jgi:hypothetical protein
MTLHQDPSRIKDIAVQIQIGRVRVIGGPDVPNIPGEEVEMSEMQRFGRILIHIGDVGIFDFKLIDLDGIKRIDGLSPSFLVDGNLFLKFLLRLGQGNVESWAADHIIADQHAGENLAPLNAQNPSGNLCDRRVGMVDLHHGQLSDFERQFRREGCLAHHKPVPFHVRVECTLDIRGQFTVDKSQTSDYQQYQDTKGQR